MKVACGFDHAGVPLREAVFATLREDGHDTIDLGTDTAEPVDYPDVALAVCNEVVSGGADRGLVVCGSGAGVAVAANKVVGIRACSIHDHYTAAQAVEHDDVNVLCLGARVIGPATASDLIRAFLGAEFSAEERHQRRLDKILAMEQQGIAAGQGGAA